MNNKFAIILNPVAGKGYAPKHIPFINEFLQNYDVNYEIHLTKHVGHAIELAAEFALLPDTAVIAAGGDGTCNEVINGLMLTKINNPDLKIEPVLGVLPIGRGKRFCFWCRCSCHAQGKPECTYSRQTCAYGCGDHKRRELS